jgi:muramoyltetrapeptide carboxypeptidase
MEPPLLRPGDTVAVVAPSGPFDPAALDAGLAWLRTRYVVRDDARLRARHGFLAGDDATRTAALRDALCDPGVRAVFAARGGYGAMRVLERAGDALLRALAQDPKPLAGFSDITALHALWARASVASVHGPMIVALGRGDVAAADRDALLDALEGRPLQRWTGLSVLRAGEARGRAAGGNLATLAALCGTPWAMPLAGAVLFVEDVTEKPYRLDRMLTQLRLAGALADVAGVVLGEFAQCDPGVDGVSAEAVLHERLVDLGVPVFAGAAFGHGVGQRVVPFGRMVSLREGGVVEFEP